MAWIKLWRKSLDSGIMQKPEVWTFWCWCLLKASHKKHSMLVGFQQVSLEPGQLVFGRKAAAQELNLTERKIRTCLKLLEKVGNLTIKATNKFSIVTIVNWHAYQSEENQNDQQGDQQVTSKRPASDHKQEGKEGKEDIYTSSTPSCPHQKIVEAYHSILPELPQVQVWSDTQKKKLAARWKEDANRQSVEWWESFFKRIRACDFLMGKVNGFRANLGWMVGPENFGKIMNGQYLNTRKVEETVY